MAFARGSGRRRYVLLVVVLAAITLITLDTRAGRSGPIGALGRVAHTILTPVQGLVDGVTGPVGDWWDGVASAGDIKKDNRKLREEIAALQGKERQAQQAIDENEELRRQLQLASIYDVELVHARVVGRDPGNFSSQLTVNQGSERGIAVGMPVVAPDGSLVGRVREVGPRFANVRVITDPQFAVGVQTPRHDDQPGTTGTAQGVTGSGELIVRDFDTQTRIDVGDATVTSPLSKNDPPDLPVGEVTRIVDKPGGVSRDVFIRPYANIGALEHVSVLLWVQGEGTVLKPTTTTTSTTVPPTTTTTLPRRQTPTTPTTRPVARTTAPTSAARNP